MDFAYKRLGWLLFFHNESVLRIVKDGVIIINVEDFYTELGLHHLKDKHTLIADSVLSINKQVLWMVLFKCW